MEQDHHIETSMGGSDMKARDTGRDSRPIVVALDKTVSLQNRLHTTTPSKSKLHLDGRSPIANQWPHPQRNQNISTESKVSWYRNSFADTTPYTAVPANDDPIEIDPPLEIPQELRPLATKRRYLRTIQLISNESESIVAPAAEVLSTSSLSQRSIPFEKSLRREDLIDMNGKKEHLKSANQKPLLKYAAHDDLSASRFSNKVVMEKAKVKATKGAYIKTSGVSTGGDSGGSSAQIARTIPLPSLVKDGLQRRRISLGDITEPKNRLTLTQDTHQVDVTLGSNADESPEIQSNLGITRHLSVEEMQDLQNSKYYFGERAKPEFYKQYRNLHSRPYLFVDKSTLPSPQKSAGTNSSNSSPASSPTESNFVPSYPSSMELKKMNLNLTPSSTKFPSRLTKLAKDDPLHGVPTQDKLSPRSHFLTSCITKSNLAVPILLRKQMTKIFDFSFQSLGDQFIKEFAKCLVKDLPFVEEILVRDNRLTDDGLNALLEAISIGSYMLNLVRLDISQNEMGPKSAQTLRSYVVSSHCTLRMLHVDNADIDDHECAAFMTAFEKNLSIKELWMSRNCIGKSENLNVVQPSFVTGGEAIASMLHSNLVLVHLDVSWNFLRLASSITLAHSIRDNNTLIELNLSYNACADAGAMMFGEALRFNQCLEVLDLSYNSIGCKGAMVLANAIRVNQTLRSLRLNGNNIGREGGQLLMFALCANTSEKGCDIELHGCNLGVSVVPLVGSSSSVASSSHLHRTATSNITMGNAGEFNVSELPIYSSASGRIFNPKEPAGRYILNLAEAYDKMIVMELVRLATFTKGCRFLRVEHRALTARGDISSAKKTITLIRKEQRPSDIKPPSSNAVSDDSDISLETRGLDALFSHIDRDKSGYIDHVEVMNVLNRIGLFPQMENITSALAAFDYNNSGFLEGGEFSAFLFHAVFKMIDSDKSGKIDADEIEEAFQMLGMTHYHDKDIAEAIATFDISGDGEMEESEFVEFLKDHLLEKIKSQLLTSLSLNQNDSSHANADASLTMLMDTSTQRPWVIPESGYMEIDFLYEREAYASNDEAHRQSKISEKGIDQLIRNITRQATSKSEQEEFFLAAIHDSEIRFTASQGYHVLEACGYMKPEDKKIEMIAHILPQMLTAKEAQIIVSRTLTISQRCRLKAEMGSAYSVVMGNSTAHYSFDLAKPKDRSALKKLAEIAQSEKLFSKQRSGRADTSQHGNWENFRNEELDGQKFVLTNAFFHVLPQRGKLCFDYVSTTRPKRGTTPMSDRRFEQLIRVLEADIPMNVKCVDPLVNQDEQVQNRKGDKIQAQTCEEGNSQKKQSIFSKQTEFWERTRTSILKRRWKFALNESAASTFQLSSATKEIVGMKIVQIESSICDRWLSCDQAMQIIRCMPTAFHARPETARILFSRIIDVENFYQIYDSLSREDQYVCAKSLGWLNIINPMAPERCYELDLSIWDEREMTKVLVELAIAEPGENWINQSFSAVKGEPGIPGWKLPVRWEKEDGKEGGVNRLGYLELEYYSGEDRGCAPVPSFRKTLLNRVLCGTKRYCL